MIDDFDVDIAKGQATHRPTGHVYTFHPTQPIDLVAVTLIRPGKESWLGESGQRDKWRFCLTAARIAA